MPLSIQNPLLVLEHVNYVEQENSEALDVFSEKLEVEGRSLWQDARRRFVHNRAAITSLVILMLITLFVFWLQCSRSLPMRIRIGG